MTALTRPEQGQPNRHGKVNGENLQGRLPRQRTEDAERGRICLPQGLTP